MIDLWNLTATVNVVEVADLIAAVIGMAVSVGNLRAAQQRLRTWIDSGRNGAVLIVARMNVRHEALRLGTQTCFALAALAGFRTRGSEVPELIVLHLALLGAVLLVLATSLSARQARRRLEREEWGE